MNRADTGAPELSDGAAAGIDALIGRVRGSVFLPDDDGYDVERAGFQTARQRRPAVVVSATGPDDVRAAVGFAGTHGLASGVQATGHGVPTATDGGVLISTRRMSGVRVDAEARIAWIEAGVRWEQVIREAAPHGLAPLSGSAPHVGAVGYTLGGGLGLLSRRYGYAADHVRRIDVVTADTRLRRVTADGDPDLFWALRGGRDNFGVVTGMEIELFPVARLYGGGLFFDADLAADVLDAYRRWTDAVPEEMTSSLALVPFPDILAVPEPIRGRHVAHVRIAYAGDAAAGERLLEPLRAVGPRLIDAVEDMPYAASGSIHNDPARPMAWSATNAMLRGLDASAARSVLELAGPGAPVPCIVEIRHLGGALSRPPAAPNAVGHRDARYMLGVLSRLEHSDVDAVRPAHQRLLDAFAPWSIGRCLNFIYGENGTTEGVRTAYDPDGYRRLAELKAVHDPTNTFRLNHNILPATEHAAR
jgi:FAD/FMN-containing dehydrogenase